MRSSLLSPYWAAASATVCLSSHGATAEVIGDDQTILLAGAGLLLFGGCESRAGQCILCEENQRSGQGGNRDKSRRSRAQGGWFSHGRLIGIALATQYQYALSRPFARTPVSSSRSGAVATKIQDPVRKSMLDIWTPGQFVVGNPRRIARCTTMRPVYESSREFKGSEVLLGQGRRARFREKDLAQTVTVFLIVLPGRTSAGRRVSPFRSNEGLRAVRRRTESRVSLPPPASRCIRVGGISRSSTMSALTITDSSAIMITIRRSPRRSLGRHRGQFRRSCDGAVSADRCGPTQRSRQVNRPELQVWDLGSSLGQYLAYARYIRETFHPSGLAVVSSSGRV